MTADKTAEALAQAMGARAGAGRCIVGLAGPPGAGKSTVAEGAARLTGARVVPMDGFHYDNAVLDARGLRERKGAPETFDADGFLNLMRRLRAGGPVAIPAFDRAADLARAGAEVIGPDERLLIVEGNYLLLDAPVWRELRPLFDLTVFLEVPEAELERRLVKRWLDHGLAPEAARLRAMGNDIPNARTVLAQSARADLTLR